MSMKIFISYAREDGEFARRIYSDLQEAGASPWLDVEDLLPGEQWKPAIRRAITESGYVLALISSHSIGKKGYVQKELKYALSVLDEYPIDEVFVIPARLDDCRPSHPILEELNWVDLFPSYENGFKRILRSLKLSGSGSSGLVTDSISQSRGDTEWQEELHSHREFEATLPKPPTKLSKTLKGHKHIISWDDFGVECVSFSPNGEMLASGGHDKTIRIWNVESGKEVRVLKGHKGSVSCVAFSPDCATVVSGGKDYTLRWWRVDTGKAIRSTKIFRDPDEVSFSPNGLTLATSGFDVITFWN